MRDIPVLQTDRLRLRRRIEDDAEAMFATYSDPVAMAWWSHPPHETVEQTREVFAEPFREWRGWSITMAGDDRAGDDRAIGFVAIGEKRQGEVSELGYLVARPHWGRGIAREAVSAVLDQVLIVEGQRRVFADTDPENAASRGLLEMLGFQLEGILRAEWETHLGIRDTALYGLLRDKWAALQQRRQQTITPVAPSPARGS